MRRGRTDDEAASIPGGDIGDDEADAATTHLMTDLTPATAGDADDVRMGLLIFVASTTDDMPGPSP
jgi:hypothetical protein